MEHAERRRANARYARDAWTETGAAALSLSADDQTVSSVQADAGVRFTRTANRMRPFAAALYRRELTDGRTPAVLGLGQGDQGQFVVDGLNFALRKEELPAELAHHIASLIEFYEHDLSAS